MSLFEWFGESYNPGPTGTVKLGGGNRPDRSRVAVIALFVISGGFLRSRACGVATPAGVTSMLGSEMRSDASCRRVFGLAARGLQC